MGSARDIGHYLTYGIRVFERGERGWRCVRVLHDVHVDGGRVRRLARLLTDYQLDPMHLYDAVCDALP